MPKSEKPMIICDSVIGVMYVMESMDIDTAPLLKAANLTHENLADRDSFIPLESLAIFMEEAARASDNDILGLEISKKAVSGGLLVQTMLHAPTVRQMLQTLHKFSSLNITNCTTELVEIDGVGHNSWAYGSSFDGMRQFLDFSAAILLKWLQMVLGENWTPLFVRLQQAEPKKLEPYIDMFGPRVRFGQEVNCFGIPSHDLSTRLPNVGGNFPQVKEGELWQYLTGLAEISLEREEDSPKTTVSVQKEITYRLPDNLASIENVAQALGKSVRSLQRDLELEGTSFSSTLEQTKKELANKYLLDTDFNVSEIAFMLGFSDVSAFTRASYRWFGESPRAYRHRHKPQ